MKAQHVIAASGRLRKHTEQGPKDVLCHLGLHPYCNDACIFWAERTVPGSHVLLIRCCGGPVDGASERVYEDMRYCGRCLS